ncbi:MAG TPA: Flp pilus assembly protein CpaB, partial [Chloroflexota bacterium]|nr:Flp pilus assembly protein CpaB [Chloroflexota bacterium]
MAVFFGLIAAYLVWNYTRDMQSRVQVAQEAIAPTPVPKVDVLIAAHDIPARTLITADMVKIAQVPVELKLGPALDKPEDAIGRVILYPLANGEQVLPAKFTIDQSIETFSNVIPAGMRAVSILTSEEIGAGGMIVPGDHIDIIASFEPALGNIAATTVFQNVLVLAVSQSFIEQTVKVTPNAASLTPISGTPVSLPISPNKQMHPDAKTLTLALSPADAQKLALATEHATLHFLLRAVDDAAVVDIAKTVLTGTTGLVPQSSVALTPATVSTGPTPILAVDLAATAPSPTPLPATPTVTTPPTPTVART